LRRQRYAFLRNAALQSRRMLHENRLGKHLSRRHLMKAEFFHDRCPE
jgi:hypothetical protein